jgi:hypothetical protein
LLLKVPKIKSPPDILKGFFSILFPSVQIMVLAERAAAAEDLPLMDDVSYDGDNTGGDGFAHEYICADVEVEALPAKRLP